MHWLWMNSEVSLSDFKSITLSLLDCIDIPSQSVEKYKLWFHKYTISRKKTVNYRTYAKLVSQMMKIFSEMQRTEIMNYP